MKTTHVIGLILVVSALLSAAVVFLNQLEEMPTAKGEPVLKHVHGFAVDNTDSNRLLIATHHGLLEFADGTLSQIGTTTDDLMGFTPHPTDPSVFFSSGHSTRGGNMGFQKSSDGGKTWEKISNGVNGPVDFHSMTLGTANPSLVYGYFGHLQRSKDSGITWEMAKGSIQPYSLSTNPKMENVLYGATQNGVMISEDYGDTWRSLSSELEGGSVSIFSLNPDGTQALAFSQILGGLAKSTDVEMTWRKINENFGQSAVIHIAYSKTAPSIVYALTQANAIYKSTDEGETWLKVY